MILLNRCYVFYPFLMGIEILLKRFICHFYVFSCVVLILGLGGN